MRCRRTWVVSINKRSSIYHLTGLINELVIVEVKFHMLLVHLMYKIPRQNATARPPSVLEVEFVRPPILLTVELFIDKRTNWRLIQRKSIINHPRSLVEITPSKLCCYFITRRTLHFGIGFMKPWHQKNCCKKAEEATKTISHWRRERG